jgi:hypothetical protein
MLVVMRKIRRRRIVAHNEKEEMKMREKEKQRQAQEEAERKIDTTQILRSG